MNTGKKRRAGSPHLADRGAGVLLHLTSLPGPNGNGDLGPTARAFADFLAAAGQSWWQMLPVAPAGSGHSPYSGSSAFAGNPLLISLEELASEELFDPSTDPPLPDQRVDYERSAARRLPSLRRATSRFAAYPKRRARLDAFRERERHWLDDYALFKALHDRYGDRPWTEWDEGLARRDPEALAAARRELASEIEHYEIEQLFFDDQWRALRSYCAERRIGLIGDIPIFVAHDSADVWANQRYFRLDERGEPTHVAGVPPDFFSKTGQRWGNPLYRWKRLAKGGYGWWIERFRKMLARFDVVRLDHFIGFARYWEIAASEETAQNGRYMKGPGAPLFERARAELGDLPFIAEDLGAVTRSVTALREQLGLPGMRVLQFAFGGDVQAAAFRPHAFERETVAYTGTHDNDTIVGWFEGQDEERPRAIEYLAGPGAAGLAGPTHWEMIRAIYASVANTAIIPLQDVLGLDNAARMNQPGKAEGNWAWRVPSGALTDDIAARLRALAVTYGR